MGVGDYKKEILEEGTSEGTFGDKAKVTFEYHISTVKGQKLDSSNDPHARPFELILGKDFLLPAWEDCIRTMKIGEKARFTCPAAQCETYARLGKALRDDAKQRHDKEHGIETAIPTHNCAASGDHERYADLYAISGQDLVFEFKLLTTRAFGAYEREHWELSLAEKWEAVPLLKEEGNALFKKGDHAGASDKYRTALGYIETLKGPATSNGTVTAEELQEYEIPCLSNYAACLLKLERYPEVIKHTTTCLELSPDHPKSLFRRARAYMLAGHLDDAKTDLDRLEQVDPNNQSLPATRKQLARISAQSAKKEKDMYQGMFSQS